MKQTGKRKETVTATISPYIKTQAQELIEAGYFSSMSDFVAIAMAELAAKCARRASNKRDNFVCDEMPKKTVHYLE
jgi:Arc/MetJ-type ribon-helix-helix transcriptional regulator